MNANTDTIEQPALPCGIALPSDHQASRELTEQAIEQEMQRLRAAAFIARIESRPREKVFAAACPVV